MCSVVGCDSWRRGAQRFNLPEDPQMRLPWIQFVAEASGQLLGLLNEASWTDITICREHFLEECFEKPVEPDRVKLKPGAVPTVRIKSEADDESVDVLQQEVPVKTEDEAGPIETVSQRTEHALYMPQSELLQDEDKPYVNNNFLFELFVHKCPSCGYSLQTTTTTQATVITLTQQCPLCEYRNEFKREIIASDTEHQSSAGSIDVTIKEEQTDDYPCDSRTFGSIKDESDVSDNEEESDDSNVASDKPDLAKEWKTTPRKGTEGKSHGDKLSGRLTVLQLCTECGAQACEHISKLYVCNVCGKKCANNVSLKRHTHTHDESYEYRCKFCHETFKKRMEKILHEQIHDYSPKPYKCLVCPETFVSVGERSIHLKSHRNRKKSKCDICGFIFTHYHLLQRHMVVHTGVKPYKCSLCERAFNQQGHLKSHMRLHTGERPYKCQYCDKAFNHNVSLKSHIQRYHTSDLCSAQP